MSALVSPSMSLVILACSSGSDASKVRMPPRWSQAMAIIAPSLPHICW